MIEKAATKPLSSTPLETISGEMVTWSRTLWVSYTTAFRKQRSEHRTSASVNSNHSPWPLRLLPDTMHRSSPASLRQVFHVKYSQGQVLSTDPLQNLTRCICRTIVYGYDLQLAWLVLGQRGLGALSYGPLLNASRHDDRERRILLGVTLVFDVPKLGNVKFTAKPLDAPSRDWEEPLQKPADL